MIGRPRSDVTNPSSLWRLERGANVQPGEGVQFSVWAPRARQVNVRVGSSADAVDVPLVRSDDGVFRAVVPDLTVGTDYVYRLDGRPFPDPVSRWQPAGVHGPSRVVDHRAFPWSDSEWRGREMAELVLYELHVGTFTAAGTFEAVIARLPVLCELGVTAIELMPVAEFPGSRNWGYDGVHPYAPQSTYGGPDGLRQLVDAAHRHGLAVVLDVVYNHLGPEGNYLHEFGPYFTDSYRTPWGGAVNFDGPDSDEVRRYVVDNALYWITEFHIDGLRLDAVHAIWDFSATHVLEDIVDAVHAQAARLGRRVVVVAESDLNNPRLIRPKPRGGYGLDGQWSDDFHHAVHAALTGEREGYYVDFGTVAPVVKALRDRFVYDGVYSRFRRRRHGAPATDVPADRFVVCIQNHDQVGNRAHGERLGALVPLAQQRLAAAMLLLSPYVPLLFMGEEYGETNPFLFFASHSDPELADAVREGRRREFAAFGWKREVPDPLSEETFLRSRLEPSRAGAPGHRELLTLYRDLLTLRREEGSLTPGTGEYTVTNDVQAGWIVLLRTAPGSRALLAAFNFGSVPAEITLSHFSGKGAWSLRLTTDDQRYGGSGAATVSSLEGTRIELPVPGVSALVYTGGND